MMPIELAVADPSGAMETGQPSTNGLSGRSPSSIMYRRSAVAQAVGTMSSTVVSLHFDNRLTRSNSIAAVLIRRCGPT